MNRLFDTSLTQDRRQYPALNLWTTGDSAFVTAELPGYKPADVNITLSEDILHIHGSRKVPECKEDAYFHRQERRFGDFERQIQMPFLVDAAKVNATFSNGILMVTLPRAEADKPKKINIKTS
jgi:HSP20 family protein